MVQPKKLIEVALPIDTINREAGPEAAAESLQAFLCLRALVRSLAYQLYMISERKGLTEDAMTYNSFCSSWAGISSCIPAKPPAATVGMTGDPL